mgnify:CR=1 FL=1
MASNVTPRVRMPATAKAGEVIQVKTLISHDMESGQRKDASGKPIPQHIINKFTATFNGKEVFTADWHPSIAANPYQAFYVRATESGTFEFSWFDDDGAVYKAEQKITVS